MSETYHVVPGKAVAEILEADQAHFIEIVRQAYLAHHSGETVNPDSYFLRFPKQPQNRIIALPAAICGEGGLSGLKWIASYPDNIRSGRVRASAALLLNDANTGYPIACLEASQISIVRTAASAVLAAHWILQDRKRIGKISFIGAGMISRGILRMFAADGWELGEICVCDPEAEYARHFAGFALRETGRVARTVALPAALAADVVVFATNAGTPHVHPPAALKPNQVVLHISLRDLAPVMLRDVNNVVDDVDHCLKASTSLHLAVDQYGSRELITGTLAELMLGEVALDAGKPTVFSPFGLGVLDLAVGKFVLDLAIKTKTAIAVDGFFPDQVRWGT